MRSSQHCMIFSTTQHTHSILLNLAKLNESELVMQKHANSQAK
jgi:hypothetical protein